MRSTLFRGSLLQVTNRYMSSGGAPKPRRVALVLAGAGVYDGSEIQEVMAVMFNVSRKGYELQCFAPDKLQHHVIDHTKGEEMNESRNCLVESSRICRGNIKPLTELPSSVDEYACLIVPGGFGAAKNLCNHATVAQGDVSKLIVEPALADSIKKFNNAEKPIGMCCIAPVIAASVLKAKVTVGKAVGDQWPYGGTVQAVINYGGSHEEMDFDGVCVDTEKKVVTSPAYMYDGKPSEIQDSVDNMVNATLAMVK